MEIAQSDGNIVTSCWIEYKKKKEMFTKLHQMSFVNHFVFQGEKRTMPSLVKHIYML